MNNIMGDQPHQVKCPFCSNSTVSTVTYKNGYLSYIACVFILLLVGLLSSLLLIPIILILTKTLIHRCSVCNEEIGGDGFVFHALKIKESMVSFKFGEMGCILTKRIVIGCVLICMTIGIFWYRISTLPEQQWQNYHHHYTPDIQINDTWKEYLEMCSRDKIFQNMEMYLKCEHQYIDKTVHWKGFAIRVEDYQQSLLKFLHHSVNILVKMDPAESEFHPDILLTADSEIAQNYTNQIELLDRGTEFSFIGVIKSIGDAQNLRHLHLISLIKEEGYIEIAPHLHSQGRYGEDQSFLSGK